MVMTSVKLLCAIFQPGLKLVSGNTYFATMWLPYMVDVIMNVVCINFRKLIISLNIHVKKHEKVNTCCCMCWSVGDQWYAPICNWVVFEPIAAGTENSR